ncbi:hypothetical protein TARUN_5563 [Trichoderma arundinaceum]|uniref:Uncharacterized protein n=1 Tax=Trichoderma arundinaceum TaxID=490622 RepID=A0A395NL25_TRIAR|nr:hypothetical protein TARUN_5563 [Trichoderma arundinaceum]
MPISRDGSDEEHAVISGLKLSPAIDLNQLAANACPGQRGAGSGWGGEDGEGEEQSGKQGADRQLQVMSVPDALQEEGKERKEERRVAVHGSMPRTPRRRKAPSKSVRVRPMHYMARTDSSCHGLGTARWDEGMGIDMLNKAAFCSAESIAQPSITSRATPLQRASEWVLLTLNLAPWYLAAIACGNSPERQGLSPKPRRPVTAACPVRSTGAPVLGAMQKCVRACAQRRKSQTTVFFIAASRSVPVAQPAPSQRHPRPHGAKKIWHASAGRNIESEILALAVNAGSGGVSAARARKLDDASLVRLPSRLARLLAFFSFAGDAIGMKPPLLAPTCSYREVASIVPYESSQAMRGPSSTTNRRSWHPLGMPPDGEEGSMNHGEVSGQGLGISWRYALLAKDA